MPPSRPGVDARKKEQEFRQQKVLAAAQAELARKAEAQARRLEQEQRQQAQAILARAEANLYAYRIALAERQLVTGNEDRADETLEECPPNLRAWEWHYLKRQCRLSYGELRTLKGEQSFMAVAFSPDGRLLAAPTQKGVKLWDATTGQELRTLPTQTTGLCLAFSPDGKRLAAAADNTTVKVWEVPSGQESLSLKGPAGPIASIGFSPDGKRLAMTSGVEVKVWDAVTGQEVRRPARQHAPRALCRLQSRQPATGGVEHGQPDRSRRRQGLGPGGREGDAHPPWPPRRRSRRRLFAGRQTPGLGLR